MSQTAWVALFAVVSFLIGSVPFGILISRAYGVSNLTSQGSGNIGATNVSRVAGFWPAGAVTFLLDLLKGTLVLLPFHFGWATIEGFAVTPPLLAFWGLMAVIGHCFSPWIGFQGGKGVATGFGVLLLLAPWSGLAGAVGFALAFLITKVGSAGSLTGMIMAGALHFIFYPIGWEAVFIGCIMLLIIYRHESNLDALLDSREKSF